eukprot:Tamp_29918.p1 GENE.Tamp_29918~~Tamp_29918.p1  ORF type:complete len:173 (-),score=20.40 Tamp_29918:16-534(-)
MISMFDCCGKRHDGHSQQRTTLHYTPRDQGPKCGVGIVFASDGTGGLVVKGFVPRSTAAQSGKVLAGDLLVQVDNIEVHRWPVAEIAPLMLGAPGSQVKLGFRRKVAWSEAAQMPDLLNGGENVQVDGNKPRPVPKLWEKGATPRNEYAQNVTDNSNHYEHFEITLPRGQVN